MILKDSTIDNNILNTSHFMCISYTVYKSRWTYEAGRGHEYRKLINVIDS